MVKLLLSIAWLRRAATIVAHLALWSAAFGLALELRFDGAIPPPYNQTAYIALGVLLLARFVAFWATGLFHGLWRYSGLPELKNLLRSTTAATVVFIVVGAMARGAQMPRSIYIGEWLASIVLVGGVRFLIRMIRERGPIRHNPSAIATLIVGAGDAGESLLRDVHRAEQSKWEIIGFLDDDPSKGGALVRGIRVLGAADDATLRRVVEQRDVKLVVLALPTADGKRTREIVNVCRQVGVQTKTIPSLAHRIEGALAFSALREIAIDDLLRREPVQLDVAQVENLLQSNTVLVTGAGGSIGSELARQALRFKPSKMLLFEHDENALFYIERELRQTFPEANIVPLIGDITDTARVQQVFAKYRPEVVVHAAAHKHVPMMEANPAEAVKNNVFGTAVVAQAARTYGVEAFVMISTDKAVNPKSVMGTTKRVAELIIQSNAGAGTRFVAVRFGNVLGSAGSVVPLFREQIAKGGPVTVTHPEMRRYFMTIPEAAQLVLQAGALGEGGEIFLLDMGEPVRIVDLARDLIELSGLRPDVDIPIQFTGLRPGEKLFEELLLSGEAYDRTPHPKIVVGRFQPTSREALQRGLSALRAALESSDESRGAASCSPSSSPKRPSLASHPSTTRAGAPPRSSSRATPACSRQ